jgi:hypothetical protein
MPTDLWQDLWEHVHPVVCATIEPTDDPGTVIVHYVDREPETLVYYGGEWRNE